MSISQHTWEENEQTYIHTNGGNGGDYLSKFQFIQDGCFPSSIKSDHKNPHLFFAKQALE